jgi:hypothetical protein
MHVVVEAIRFLDARGFEIDNLIFNCSGGGEDLSGIKVKNTGVQNNASRPE